MGSGVWRHAFRGSPRLRGTVAGRVPAPCTRAAQSAFWIVLEGCSPKAARPC